jgi:folate-binding protein YgfZ
MAEITLHERSAASADPEQSRDLAGELQALALKAAVFELSGCAQVTVTGKDRVRWLHNMVTNNVRELPLNRGNYNFVLNAQGRILGDLYIFNRGDFLLLETGRLQLETVLATLRRFIIMDKVELTPSESQSGVGICGPEAEGILGACGLNATGIESLEIRDVTEGGISAVLIRGPEQKPHWYELWADQNDVPRLQERLIGAGAQPVGTEALELWRVLRGVPKYGQDIRERDLPQETGQMRALHFSKGCYIGQEIVERIRSRGQVHRQFTGFEFNALPAPGRLESEGRTLAEITTAVRVPTATGERFLGLGYVRREALTPGSELDFHGVRARVAELPFNIKLN